MSSLAEHLTPEQLDHLADLRTDVKILSLPQRHPVPTHRCAVMGGRSRGVQQKLDKVARLAKAERVDRRKIIRLVVEIEALRRPVGRA